MHPDGMSSHRPHNSHLTGERDALREVGQGVCSPSSGRLSASAKRATHTEPRDSVCAPMNRSPHPSQRRTVQGFSSGTRLAHRFDYLLDNSSSVNVIGMCRIVEHNSMLERGRTELIDVVIRNVRTTVQQRAYLGA